MSNSPDPAGNEFANISREDMMSALFGNLILQQTNMAMMLLGRMPHPETGELVKDSESARIFIDLLEMLELKTKGNRDKQEDDLLQQSLMAVRMAFVEEIDREEASQLGAPQPATPPAP